MDSRSTKESSDPNAAQVGAKQAGGGGGALQYTCPQMLQPFGCQLGSRRSLWCRSVILGKRNTDAFQILDLFRVDL